MQRPSAVLAPTGRAARVLNYKTGLAASTIHSCIYDFDSLVGTVDEEGKGPDQGPGFTLHFKLKPNDGLATVYIIDESSMVSDSAAKQEMLRFGSGKLLSDLIRFSNVSRHGSVGKLILIGDHCQLPPVDMSISPALDANYIKEHHQLDSAVATLHTVLRQSSDSAILGRASQLRLQIDENSFNRIDLSPEEGQIVAVQPGELIAKATEAARKGRWLPIIAYSNKQVAQYNKAVRGRLWGDEQAPPQSGDYLIVIKNSSKYKLLNGDNVKIASASAGQQVRTVALRGRAPVELRFRKLRIVQILPNGEELLQEAIVLENTLSSSERQPTEDEMRALYVDFIQRHSGLRPGTAEFNLVLAEDPYFNALLVKFGYALTCHKAQGGEWNDVAVDFTGFSGLHNADFFRWVYTAVTRAKKVLFTIDAPRFDEFSGIRRPALAVPSLVEEAESFPGSASLDDPDYLRYSFPADKPFLFDYFVKLRDGWQATSIMVESVRHLPYQEQVTVRLDNDLAIIQYHYNGKGGLSASGPSALPGGGALGDAALAIARQVLSVVGEATVVVRSPFLTGLEKRVRAAVVASGVELHAMKSMPYRERYEFMQGGKLISLDFHFNGKEQWTGIQQVGGDTPAGTELKLRISNSLET